MQLGNEQQAHSRRFGVPVLALIEKFDSKLADVGNPLVSRQ